MRMNREQRGVERRIERKLDERDDVLKNKRGREKEEHEKEGERNESCQEKE